MFKFIKKATICPVISVALKAGLQTTQRRRGERLQQDSDKLVDIDSEIRNRNMSYLEELDLEEEGLTEEEIKKRKTKIFVGGLKYSSKDDVLKEYFSQFGEIEEAVVIYDRESGLSKGYGFVSFNTLLSFFIVHD